MEQSVTESQFFMWRTLFAVAHADNIVTQEEVEFMVHVLEDVEFSEAQTKVLKDDILNAKDPEVMFKGITAYEDRAKFFEFARDLVWVDGTYDTQEQSVMISLGKIHSHETDFDSLIGHVNLQLEEEKVSSNQDLPVVEEERRGLIGVVSRFQKRFMDWFD